MAESTTPPLAPAHVALATVFQVRDAELTVLLWERAREPHSGAWALPGGTLAGDETLEESILRHLATKVDVREVAHLEQLGTWSEPRATRTAGSSRPPTSGSCRSAWIRAFPRTRAGSRSMPLPPTAFDHGAIVLAGRDRLRGKLSYSNIGFALAPETFTLAELRDVYEAALGYEVSATNLKRVLLRRGAIESVGRGGGPTARGRDARPSSTASGSAGSR